jgi:hypothetical protein
LKAEIAEAPGDIELVRNLGRWLLTQLPWTSESLEEAVARSRDQQFWELYLQSDLQGELVPEAKDLGFRRAPYSVEITEVTWGGMFAPLGAVKSPDGLILAEYDLNQLVDFEAELPEGSEIEEGWEASEPDYLGRIAVRGQIPMVVRLGVLFEDDFVMGIEKLSWRRSDGSGPGAVPLEPIPGQLSLFDSK